MKTYQIRGTYSPTKIFRHLLSTVAFVIKKQFRYYLDQVIMRMNK